MKYVRVKRRWYKDRPYCAKYSNGKKVKCVEARRWDNPAKSQRDLNRHPLGKTALRNQAQGNGLWALLSGALGPMFGPAPPPKQKATRQKKCSAGKCPAPKGNPIAEVFSKKSRTGKQQMQKQPPRKRKVVNPLTAIIPRNKYQEDFEEEMEALYLERHSPEFKKARKDYNDLLYKTFFKQERRKQREKDRNVANALKRPIAIEWWQRSVVPDQSVIEEISAPNPLTSVLVDREKSSTVNPGFRKTLISQFWSAFPQATVGDVNPISSIAEEVRLSNPQPGKGGVINNEFGRTLRSRFTNWLYSNEEEAREVQPFNPIWDVPSEYIDEPKMNREARRGLMERFTTFSEANVKGANPLTGALSPILGASPSQKNRGIATSIPLGSMRGRRSNTLPQGTIEVENPLTLQWTRNIAPIEYVKQKRKKKMDTEVQPLLLEYGGESAGSRPTYQPPESNPFFSIVTTFANPQKRNRGIIKESFVPKDQVKAKSLDKLEQKMIHLLQQRNKVTSEFTKTKQYFLRANFATTVNTTALKKERIKELQAERQKLDRKIEKLNKIMKK